MYMRVWCSRCGKRWEVYHRDFDSDKARTCPHCYERASTGAWAKTLRAAQAFETANRALFADVGAKAVHTVDFIDDTVYENMRGRYDE